jgi:Domain of unknown function (DUF4386)
MNLARTAGACYLVTVVAGLWALFGPGFRVEANAIAAASYVAVTVLFYVLFRPVHARVSLVAAVVGLAGCALSGLVMSRAIASPINPLSLFGVYCLLIGWLVLRSTLPRALGVLMMFAGVGWLTFAVPAVSRALAPYNFVPGIVSETVLTLWLLATGPVVRRRPGAGDGR